MIDLCTHVEPVWAEKDNPAAGAPRTLAALLRVESRLTSFLIFRDFSCPLEKHLHRLRLPLSSSWVFTDGTQLSAPI
jgi:hypothetical protein